jgi:hypothetical protein
MINCFGYLIPFITALFFPDYNDKAFLYLQPVLFGELAIMLWLLIKGAKVVPVPAGTLLTNSGVQARQQPSALRETRPSPRN